ncbi:MAG: hypothetical protein ACRDJP_05080 [Actinomycetota bacterium]
MAPIRDPDQLYDLRPEEFTAARDGLVRSLKDAGDADAAAEVKKLRRPTVVAWAINQLVRRHRKRVEELIESGEALRAAQRRAMSGVKDGAFREATERRRELVQALTRDTVIILEEAERGSQGAEEEVGRALEAASVDPAAGEELLAARLTKPLTGSSGFEAVSGFEVFSGAGEEEAAADDSDAEREALEVAVRNAERQAEQAEADARRAEMRAENLERQLEETSRKASEARGEAERLQAEAADAAKRLERARKELDAG